MPDPDPTSGGPGNGNQPPAGGRVAPDPSRSDEWTKEEWQTWYDEQPGGVRRMLDNQARAAVNFEAIRTRFGEDYEVIDQAMRDEERLKELRRLRDPRFYDFTIKRGGKIFDETLAGGGEGGGGGGGGRTEPSPTDKKLDEVIGRLNAKDLEERKNSYIENRNQEFIALAREHPDLFMQHDEATDPDAKEKNALARKRAERLVNLAEHRSKAMYGEMYFAKNERVALKDVLDDVLMFTDRQSDRQPPPAAPRLSRSGPVADRREPEPSDDPQVVREQMLRNMRAAGGFARSARTGRG